MKKLFFALFTAVMCLMLTAYAADGDTYNVKYGAIDLQSVYNQIAEMEFPGGGWSVSRAPAHLQKDTTISIACGEETRTVQIHLVMPAFSTQDIPGISADSKYNETAAALQDYAFQYRTLTQVSDDYTAAMGTPPIFELSRYSIGRDYEQTGKTYTLSQVYMEQTVTQTLTVTSVSNREPDVSISNNGTVSCTPSTVQYSLDRKTWSNIRDGSAIPSTCYGETVYFRSPANAYAEASDYVRVYVKDQQTMPKTKPELSATSFSVTINNVDQFDSSYEFSLGGDRWSNKTTWTDLEPNTKYTVYVRYKSTSSYFASSAVSATISTKEGSTNAITYTKASNANTTYFMASGTTRLSMSNNTLSATYTDSTVSKLKNDVKNAERHMSAVTVLDVRMEQEEGDYRSFTKVKFVMPKDLGLLQLRLTTPYCTLIVSDASTSLEIEAIKKNTTTAGLKDFVAKKDLVYKVVTQGEGSIQILYPWEFPSRADLSGLQVTYMDTKYKERQVLKYQEVSGGILFTMPDDGYFAITNLYRDYGSLPFTDVQTHWAYSYIHYAYENDLVKGVSATQFSPDTNVTRAQLAVLLARMAGADPSTPYMHPYTDIAPDAWYGWAVGYLWQRGVLHDVDGGMFKADEGVTREQTIALIGKVIPYTGTIWRPMDCTDREQVSAYALEALDGLYNRNVIKGSTGGNFNPTSTLTRAELVTILYRLATS